MIPEFIIESTTALDGLTFSVNANSTKRRQSLYFVGQLDAGSVTAVIELMRAGTVVAELPCDIGSGARLRNAFPSGGLSFENAVSVVLPAAGTFLEQSFTVCPRHVFETCDSVRFRLLAYSGATEFRAFMACFSDT